jgi:hypothetical protein
MAALRIQALFITLTLACVPACATGSSDQFVTGAGGSSTGAGGSSQGNGGSSLAGLGTGSTGAGGAAAFHAYAHSATTLYSLDPSAQQLAVTTIGDFDCIGGYGSQDSSMTDLAVSEAGDLWGISSHNIYHLEVQGSKVHCGVIIPLSASYDVVFYGLTFAPKGVLDPNKEVLVATNTAGELWAVDDMGNLTPHGTFGTVPANDGHGHAYQHPGTAWELSGDIVFLANNGSPVGFATVRDCPNPPSSSNCNTTDTLIEIDVPMLKTATKQSVTKSVRGQVVKAAGCADPSNASYGSMFGIAAWNANVYGFSHEGFIVQIDNNDGSACLLQGTPSNSWDGAAVTTLAPVIPPTTK